MDAPDAPLTDSPVVFMADLPPVEAVAAFLSAATHALRGAELYREDIEELTQPLRELAAAVRDAGELGRRAALLKKRNETRQEASVIQLGADPTADLLRNANKLVGG